jgi:hypothetical protein
MQHDFTCRRVNLGSGTFGNHRVVKLWTAFVFQFESLFEILVGHRVTHILFSLMIF